MPSEEGARTVVQRKAGRLCGGGRGAISRSTDYSITLPARRRPLSGSAFIPAGYTLVAEPTMRIARAWVVSG
jgi:hypothetical protein